MTPEQFNLYAQQGYNRIPVCRKVLADLDTPLSAYLKLADGKFLPAVAVITGFNVVVSSQQVATPTIVRYGWTNVPDGNLFNAAGLPASPFRSNAD